jgi:biopolymer transport protein ExbB/TolQ
MMPRFLIACIAGLATAGAAPSPTAPANDPLQDAATRLASARKEYAGLRLALYRDINQLDDQATALAKELRELEREEELRTARTRTLEREIETRKADFTYLSGVLGQYAKALVTRLHPAEFQLHRAAIESLDQRAGGNAAEPRAHLEDRLAIVETGLTRISSIAGLQGFAGKALGRGGQALEGKLLMAGPAVFFASADRAFEGIASVADTGSGLATIVPPGDTQGAIAKAVESGSGEVPLDATNGRAIERALKNPGNHGGAMEHVMLFGDIAKNMMFDGWIAVGLCVVMVAVGWSVALKKLFYLNSVRAGNEAFLRQWSILSSDLTAIDQGEGHIGNIGGNADSATQELIRKSPFFDIYHIGSEEIRHRLEQDRNRKKGLSGRSVQAIRAALDAGLVRANHKLTNGLIYLTISIAGGPYIGLLGTVVGVMITFAVIAKSGEVDVNSIAPGIASALLATVAGLIVAIPALFIYSYLNGRIKNMIGEMQVFIDEFIAKVAEFYQGAGNPNTEAHSKD